MNIATVKLIAREVLQILGEYHNPSERELHVDAVLMAVLRGRQIPVERQHWIRLKNSTRPHRIDFRIGSSNPVLVELAVRSVHNRGSLCGSVNQSELDKLCRVPSSRAKLRVLLLLDFLAAPLSREVLSRSYEPLHAGRGNFQRSSVRIVYVHREAEFDFVWRPFKTMTRAETLH